MATCQRVENDREEPARQRSSEGRLFSTNHFVYVQYTQDGGSDEEPSHNRIVRFTADTDNPNVAVEQDGIGDSIFELDDLGVSNKHNGGHIHFGNDGKLYIPAGDNKRDRDPVEPINTLKLTNLFGKVLRINADGTIPADNPFLDRTMGQNRAIYARGRRNPFSFAVEPAPGNKIYINDVGEQTWEEINDLKAGANYGWPRHEGFEGGARFEKPIFAYKHDSGCAITGGTFYYPPAGASTPFPARGDPAQHLVSTLAPSGRQLVSISACSAARLLHCHAVRVEFPAEALSSAAEGRTALLPS